MHGLVRALLSAWFAAWLGVVGVAHEAFGATQGRLSAATNLGLSDYRGITSTRYASAYCESSGNIHAIGWHGLYRGKWQFDWSTWRAYAPRAWRMTDPAYAPEWVQDQAALNVPYDAWPNC